MAYVRIWVHIVWGTKNRSPYLKGDVKKLVIEHIKENVKSKNIYINCIDGHHDHLHALIGLSADAPVSKIVQLIKGESTFWINKQQLTKERFEWADDYYAASVSESHVDRVKNYINTQELHHTKTTFKQEYDEFIASYNLLQG